MTRQQLITGINAVLNQEEELSTVVYALMKETNQLKKLNIANDEIEVIQTMFIESIGNSILNVEDQGIVRVSETDDRANTVFEYDLELPADLNYLETEL